MENDNPEMVLTPSSSSVGGTILFCLAMAFGCFYLSTNQEGFFSYFLIGAAMVFVGLIFYLGLGTQGAYLKLSVKGMEFKFPAQKLTFVPWEHIEKFQIMEMANLNVVGVTYTEESARTKYMTKKMNNLFAKGADLTLPTHYPIELGDLYLLVYGWKLGYYIDDLEEIELNKIEIVADIVVYEESLKHKDSNHFDDFS